MTPADILINVREARDANANEAQTRHKVIDPVIYSILNWTNSDVTVEERVSEDGQEMFVDYLCKTAQTSILIEAKRIGINFRAPNVRRPQLKGSWNRGAIQKAILQARDYARSKHAGFAVATNGDAWILFPVNRRDLITFEESNCIVFANAETALNFDLSEFVSLLSREAVIDGSLDEALFGARSDQTDTRRLNQIYDRSFSKISRVSVFSYVESEIVTAFQEEFINDNPDLLARSYVETPERVRFDERIKMYVTKREQVLSARPMRPVGKGDTKNVADKIVSMQVSARPIALLTLGLVGSGKTTFLNYISKVSAAKHFAYETSKASAHWVYADFRDFSLVKSPRDLIIEAAFKYIGGHPFLRSRERCLKFAYANEIENLKEGPLYHLKDDPERFEEAVGQILYSDYQQKEPYVTKIFSYAAKNAPVFVVVDNVDQIEDVEVQSKVFLDALSFARTVGANLVVAMRDATYVKNRASPVFDAFDFDAIYIDAPDIQAVLSKRFIIAEQLLRGKKIEFTTETGVRVQIDDARVIVEMLKAAILGTGVGRLIEVTATGDTRLALQMTRQFLQYGYSSSQRAIEIYQRTGKYNLPPHEALRGIMFGNQSIYRDSFSPIGNPFDAYLGKTDAQLLRLYIISVLVNSAAVREFDGMEASDIIDNLQKMGFSERLSEKVIKDLIAKRFVHSRSHQEYTRESVLIPSRLAGYVVRELIGRMMFLETTMFDTFIATDGIWTQLKELVRKIYSQHNLIAKLKVRKEAVQLFFDFLEASMENLIGEARRRALPPVWCINPLTRVRSGLADDLTKALSSAQRNYGDSADANFLPVERKA